MLKKNKEICTSRCDIYNDYRWQSKDETIRVPFQTKVYNFWFGILHFVNFIILLVIGLQYNILLESQTLTDSSLIPIGNVCVGVFVLVCIVLTSVYLMFYEIAFYFSCCNDLISKDVVFSDITFNKNKYRWIQYGFNNCLILFAIYVISGITDVNFIVFFCVLNIFVNAIFEMHERNGGIEADWIAMFISLIQWAYTIRQAVLVNANSYASSAIAFGIANTIFIFIIVRQNYKLNAVNYEFSFNLLEFLFKTIVSWLIFGYLLHT